MIIQRDPWLSEQLGHDAFRVAVEPRVERVGGETTTGADPDLHFLASCFPARAAQAQPAFYYAKVPTHQVETVAALNTLGFRVVDVSITLSCAPQVITHPVCHTGLVVREATAPDGEVLLSIAASCFRYSRFHLDPAIPPERANAIKRAWVRSYLTRQRGERLLAAFVHERPVGFLAVLETKVKGKNARIIDLVGVDHTQQGRGVGKALVGAFLVECTKRETLAVVGTQAANLPSLRLYESMGFRVCETTYVLHAHVGGGGSGR
jgi:ribosomal protein S18 acetylase RimI-like enzyme